MAATKNPVLKGKESKKGKENMSVRETLKNQKRKRNLSLNIRNNLPNAGAAR